MEKRLIKKVFEHPFLYTVDHTHYRDRQMRASAWTDIGKDLGMSAQQCKEMWRKLRNCYLNAINRRQHKNIPKWKYETEMAFLLPYLDTALVNRSQLELEHVSPPAYSDIAIYDPSTSPPSPEMILPETSGITMITTNSRRETLQEGEDELSTPTTPASTSLEKKKRHDETEMFFLSISETVKRLHPVDQARIKKELCSMVYEAEINMLQEDANQ